MRICQNFYETTKRNTKLKNLYFDRSDFTVQRNRSTDVRGAVPAKKAYSSATQDSTSVLQADLLYGGTKSSRSRPSKNYGCSRQLSNCIFTYQKDPPKVFLEFNSQKGY